MSEGTMALVGVLVLAGLAWFGLIQLQEDAKKALELGEAFLGFATSLAGFLGIAVGAGNSMVADTDTKRVTAGQSGAVGLGALLAGGTIMGVGGWATPVALSTLFLGAGAVGFARAWKK